MEHDDPLYRPLMLAVRAADEAFEKAGDAGTKTWLDDYFLPELANHNLALVEVGSEPQPPDNAESDDRGAAALAPLLHETFYAASREWGQSTGAVRFAAVFKRQAAAILGEHGRYIADGREVERLRAVAVAAERWIATDAAYYAKGGTVTWSAVLHARSELRYALAVLRADPEGAGS
jgi:hypothetical protein